MTNHEDGIITENMVNQIKDLIASKEEVNLEWLKAITQLPLTLISKIIIQRLGMVVFEGIVYSKAKAERKLQQMQAEAQITVERESFRTGPVKIDMMKLREKLWTVNLSERLFGQDRHQFCAVWSFLEGKDETSIVLRNNWLTRLQTNINANVYKKLKQIKALNIMNELGEEYTGKAKVIFALTVPRQLGNEKKAIWIMFLVSENGSIRLEGFNMINVLSLSTKFRSRENAYAILNEYIELVNLIVIEPSLFEEVIVVH